jgi:hypothetical protein
MAAMPASIRARFSSSQSAALRPTSTRRSSLWPISRSSQAPRKQIPLPPYRHGADLAAPSATFSPDKIRAGTSENLVR